MSKRRNGSVGHTVKIGPNAQINEIDQLSTLCRTPTHRCTESGKHMAAERNKRKTIKVMGKICIQGMKNPSLKTNQDKCITSLINKSMFIP